MASPTPSEQARADARQVTVGRMRAPITPSQQLALFVSPKFFEVGQHLLHKHGFITWQSSTKVIEIHAYARASWLTAQL